MQRNMRHLYVLGQKANPEEATGSSGLEGGFYPYKHQRVVLSKDNGYIYGKWNLGWVKGRLQFMC